MAMNLNRRKGKKGGNIPLGSIGIIKEVSKEPKKKTKETPKEVASVVVTICESASYDELFRKLPQESEYGRVNVYSVKPGMMLELIQKALSNEIIDNFKDSKGSALAPKTRDILKQLKKDCDEAGADAVCVNFECCGAYTSAGFVQSGNKKYKDIYLDFITFLATDFGCMQMFSDFSLKALIADWDAERLGPNPFENVGEFGGSMQLGFDPEKLKLSPSAQLNTVGSLSENGTAKLHAMIGTIAFTITDEAQNIANETEELAEEQKEVSPEKMKYLEPYEVQVLTVATEFCNKAFTKNKLKELEKSDKLVVCEEKEKRGLAGHVLLTFPPSDKNMKKYAEDIKEEAEAKARALKEGKIIDIEDENEESDVTPIRGMILVSCGHWSELMKIDVNMDRLLKTVQTEWGQEAEVYQEMNARYEGYTKAEQTTNSNMDAVKYMQSRAPAKFNKRLVRKKKKGY